MTYGYVRVSTDKQRVDNQEFEINQFCKKNNIVIDEWIKETVSGTKTPDKRKPGGLLDRTCKNDLIICSELSRLGRSLLMIMSILNQLMEKGVKVGVLKDRLIQRLLEDGAEKRGSNKPLARRVIPIRTNRSLPKKIPRKAYFHHNHKSNC